MYYEEYLRCADMHLKSCSSLLANYTPNKSTDFEVYYELYYLAGYIIEGLTIHSAYKLNQWQNTYEIDDRYYYDSAFVKRTNLDFYHYRYINGKEIKHSGMKVMGHNFQQIASNLLMSQGPFANDNLTPYFGKGPISPDVKRLIDLWKPGARYLHNKHADLSLYPKLSHELLVELIDTCKLIFDRVMIVVGI